MGIVVDKVVFQSTAPSYASLADKITELSGLPVLIEEDEPVFTEEDKFENDESSYPRFARASYIRFAHISFRSTPRNQVQLYVSCHDADDKSCSTQTVHLRIYAGQEETLFRQTVLALEALGGSAEYQLPENARQKYVKSLTPSQIRWRSVKNNALVILVYLIGILLLPILLPIWLFQLLRLWISIPKIVRETLAELEDHDDTA
jgi:hypothetical protein